jgi:Tol biopolymer transport system component/predicted Ser/Thr protein kinase
VEASDLSPGTHLGAYRIERRLGRGGMSVVYLAEHLQLSRLVALKVLPSRLARDQEFRLRFERESKLAASLDHPNIVPVHDAGEADGLLYIAMRFVEGKDLGKLLREEGRLEPERALSILGQTAEALDEAHTAGLVHRDVKPANILLTASPREQYEHAYLTDFGLARAFASGSRLTRSGYYLGTIHYSSPEQFTGSNVDGRTDVYSLGCVAFECLTGKVPFERDHEPAVMFAHLQEEPPRVTAQRPDLADTVDDVVTAAMAKVPEERFPTCGQLVEALRDAVAGRTVPFVVAHAKTRPRVPAVPADVPPVPAVAGALPGVPAPEARRSMAPLIAAIGIMVAAGIGVGGFLLTREAAREGSAGASVAGTQPGAEAEEGVQPQIVFTTTKDGNDDVYVMNADGTGIRRLTDNPGLDFCPSWSPDHARIAFFSDRERDGDIFVMNPDGTGAVPLSGRPLGGLCPSWSPDGTRVGFYGGAGGKEEIYVVNADGTGLTRLTDNPGRDYAPSWSPDGTRIAFVRTQSGQEDIYVMNADGTEQARLTEDPGAESSPDWSPDGSRIAFDSERDGNQEIYVMSTDGTGLVNLTNNPADDSGPVWSPDGSRIVFVSTRDGTEELYVMDADGGGVVRLTTNRLEDQGPDW